MAVRDRLGRAARRSACVTRTSGLFWELLLEEREKQKGWGAYRRRNRRPQPSLSEDRFTNRVQSAGRVPPGDLFVAPRVVKGPEVHLHYRIRGDFGLLAASLLNGKVGELLL